MKPLTLAAVIALGATTQLSAQSYQDTILTSEGARIRGVQVTAMTTEFVTYEKGGSEEQIRSDNVDSIVWDQAPTRFNEAVAKEREGAYDDAANYYQESVDQTDREPLKLAARFFAGRAALAGAGFDADKAEAAANALSSYVSDAGDGYYARHARLLMARAKIRQDDAAGADSDLQQLESEATEGAWGIAWDARIKFERASALLALGKAGDARSAYRRVVSAVDAAISGGSKDAELVTLKTQSLVGEGESYIAENNPDQALTFFRNYTSSTDSAVLQAAALAGEGQALFLRASAASDDKGLREAQTALAKANVLDSDSGETTAKALFYTGKIFLALGPDKERDAIGRGKAYFDTIVRYYPATSWAAKARAELAK